MKKSLIFFCLAVLTLSLFSMTSKVVQAEEEPIGTIVLHYQNWDNNYENTGLWIWGNGGTTSAIDRAGVDDFGGYYNIPVYAGADAEVGAIPMNSGYINGSNYTGWDNGWVKGANDAKINVDAIKGGQKEIHAYVFYSPDMAGGSPVFIADPAKVNVLVLYYAPSYEPNLGFHAWGGFSVGEASWGTPIDLFKTGAYSPSSKDVKVAMLSSEAGDGGFLIYAGGDDSKKTPDQGTHLYVEDITNKPAGSVSVVYATGGKAWSGATAHDTFVGTAFNFKFDEREVADDGKVTGTYASNPLSIIAKLSQAITVLEEYDTGRVDITTETVQKWMPVEGEEYKQTTISQTKVTSLPAMSAGAAGRIIFHHQIWDGDYTNAGLWTWGGITSDGVKAIGSDEFGAVSIVEFASTSGDIGLIPIRKEIENVNRWSYRETPDGQHITYNVSGKSGDIHLYYFEGGLQTYYEYDPLKANVFVVLHDSVYEENLGLHAWGSAFPEATWGTPYQVFTDGYADPSGAKGKVAFLQAESFDGCGFLIYAGDDATKKTFANAGDSITDFAALKAGDLRVLYVAAGATPEDGVTFYGENAKAEFATISFAPVELRDVEVEVETPIIDTRKKDLSAVFQLFVDGEQVPFERIDFSDTAETASDFVFVLSEANKLDNTKEYTLKYIGGDEPIEIIVDVDKEAPVISIIGNKEIKVSQGVEWDQAKFPVVTASDDRDGNINNRVFVKSGEGNLDPNVPGNYKITLTVNDEWGNEGRAEFTIVVEPAKAGPSTGLIVLFVCLGVVVIAGGLLFVFKDKIFKKPEA